MPGRLHWLWIGALAMAAAAPLRAATFNVSPVRVDLSAAAPTGVLSVTNDGDASTVVQCQAVSWSQHEGRDVYAATADLIATPPIFTIAPGKKQIVRVGLLRPPLGPNEATYRVYLQEIPGPPKPGFQGLQIALRIGVPVFVAPATAARPVLHWSAQRAPDGAVEIELRNTGAAHVQVFDFVVSQPGASTAESREQVSAYVLAGQSKRWALRSLRPAPRAGETLHLKAYTDAGKIDKDLVLLGP